MRYSLPDALPFVIGTGRRNINRVALASTAEWCRVMQKAKTDHMHGLYSVHGRNGSEERFLCASVLDEGISQQQIDGP